MIAGLQRIAVAVALLVAVAAAVYFGQRWYERLLTVQTTDAPMCGARSPPHRATKFPSPVFDRALAECEADKSWSTFETNSYHIVMLDEPEWLADTLQQAA